MNSIISNEKKGRSLIGQLGEMLAAEFLRKRGYTILERNYRSAVGEIDIVAVIDNVLIFAEVRTRATDECGHPLESIGIRKQRKLREVAQHYFRDRSPGYPECRFDALAVILREGEEAHFELVPNAF